jgi:hypothetical protein
MNKISFLLTLSLLAISIKSYSFQPEISFVNNTPYTIGFRMVTGTGGHSYDPVTLAPGKTWTTNENAPFHIDFANDWDNADKNQQWLPKAKNKNRDWGLSFDDWQYEVGTTSYKAEFLWNKEWNAPQLRDLKSGKFYNLR